MKQKFSLLISMVLCLCIVSAMLPQVSLTAFAQDTLSVKSPDEKIKLNFSLSEDGQPTYSLQSGSYQLIESSKLGLNTSIGDFADGFEIKSTQTDSYSGSFNPLVGEQQTILDNYNSLTVVLTHKSTGKDITIEMRAYNEGAAFRYKLPENDESYNVTGELTSFKLPSGSIASAHVNGNQTNTTKITAENLTNANYRRPMEILYPNGYALTLCEANSFNYCSLQLTSKKGTCELLSVYPEGLKNSNSTITSPNYVTVTNGDPAYTPWRVFVCGTSENELPKNATIVECLNPAPDEETYKFSEWVNPGTCLRAASGMNTTSIKNIVDQAADHGIKYVLLDTGWYGPEVDPNCDPRLDPSKLDDTNPSDKILKEQYFATEGGYNNTGEGVFNSGDVGFDVYKPLGNTGSMKTNVDIPAICDYANNKDVGIILYVNGVFFPDSSGRNRFDADELFAYFEKWGVKGVKPGFVACRSQQFEKEVEDVIRAAAKHKLIMTIHDEYVPAGIQRTFPHLLCTEGILGDEGIGKTTPDVEYDITTLLTRPLQSPTDHTYCYPGKGTKAYAIASPIMFRTGMNVLYWYTAPNSIPTVDRGRLKIWDNMPTTWKQSLFLEAKSYEYATYARQSFDGRWYIGSLSATDRTLKIPLTFLDDSKTYTAEIYRDGSDADAYAGWNSGAKSNQTLLIDSYTVDNTTVLENKMAYGSGYAVLITESTSSNEVYCYEKIALSDTIDECEEIVQTDYTAETYAIFAQALNDAKTVLNSDTSVSSDYKTALENLTNAKENLKYSFTNLNTLIKKAEKYNEYLYTADSYSTLEKAIKEAKDATADEKDYTVSQIKEIENKLSSAINSLVKTNASPLTQTYVTAQNQLALKFTGTAASIQYNKNRAAGDLRLLVDGEVKTFAHGIGIDAPSYMILSVPENSDLFEAYVGIDYTKASNNQGSVAFSVYDVSDIDQSSYSSLITASQNTLSDSLLLASTDTVYGKTTTNAVKINAPVKGVSKILIYNDMVENQNSDWADWCDACFTTYADPAKAISDIKINSVSLTDYNAYKYDYYLNADDYSSVPEIVATLSDTNASVSYQKPSSIPGTALVKLTASNGKVILYRLHFCTFSTQKYLSDLNHTSATVLNNAVFKNKDRAGNAITVWDKGGNAVVYEKGVGADATTTGDSSVIYDISAYDFESFETYASVSYYAYQNEVLQGKGDDPRSSIQYEFYLDDKLVYTTGILKCKTPAEHVSFDINSANTLKIVFDAGENQAADWGVLADAKFVSFNYNQEDYSNLTYTLDYDNLTASITGFVTKPETNAKIKLTIPSSIEGFIVTSIADNAFKESGATTSDGENRISEVVLPNTVKTIGNNAFCDCCALKSINFPEGLEQIGANAFRHAGAINFAAPSTLKTIGDSAFIYSGVQVISLNDGLKSIGKQAFHWVGGCVDITIPNTVTYIGTGAFRVCQNLKTLTFPRNSEYTAIDKDVLAIDRSPQKINITKLYIPETITDVPSQLFASFAEGNTCTVYAQKDSAAWKTVENLKESGYSGINNNATFVLSEYDYTTQNRYSKISAMAVNGTITPTVNGTAQSPLTTMTTNYKVGTKIGFTAAPESDSQTFLYWLDMNSGRILSYDISCDFIVGTDKNLCAVFTEENTNYITFTNANRQLLASGSNNVTVPKNPYISGYEFKGWYLDSVLQNINVGDILPAPDKDMFYRAGFVKSQNTYTVSVTGANEQGGAYYYNDKVTLTAKDKSSENLIFAYWLKNGSKVSYNQTYTFYVSENCEIEAVYLSDATVKDSIVTLSAAQTDASRISFFAEYDICPEFTVIEAGILLSANSGITVDNAQIKATAQSKNNKSQFTIRKANLSSGDTYYGKAYVIYTDSVNMYTIYSNEASYTLK